MNSRIVKNTIDARTGRIEDGCARYGVGKSTMRKLASDANAVIHYGKCYLIDFAKVDKYMDSISGE